MNCKICEKEFDSDFVGEYIEPTVHLLFSQRQIWSKLGPFLSDYFDMELPSETDLCSTCFRKITHKMNMIGLAIKDGKWF